MSDKMDAHTKSLRERLKEKMMKRMPKPGVDVTMISGLRMFRKDHINFEPGNCFYQPFVSMPVQGFKRSVIGAEEYRYGENHYFIASVDLPTMSYFTKATPEKPFLAVNLDLDRQLIRQLVTEIPADVGQKTRSEKGLVVAETDPDILNVFLRLVELLDKPEQIPFLAPLIIREMHVRLLLGPQGAVLRAVNSSGTQSSRISDAIIWLRDNYTRPLQIDELAHKANGTSLYNVTQYLYGQGLG